MTEDIKVTFIIPKDFKDESECSEEMQLAFIACEQHRGGGLQVQWVHEAKWHQFEGLTKKDVFVLSQFDGDLYQKLKLTKCLLLGPRCLSCCLTEGTPIPSGSEPIFTVAMRGLVVTASGLSKDEKEEVKQKVEWMGGTYNTVLTDATTHLVSDTVLSDKYIKAVEKGIPVMSGKWVEAVWNASLHLNVNGSSSDFNEHRLPPFAKLEITTTGLTRKDKQKIMKLVNENGGRFSGAFQSVSTNVVVLTKDGIGSEKYKAALEYDTPCVLPDWIKDSASRGVALPFARYRLVGASTSSPLTEHRPPDMSLNFSRITNSRPPSNFVDETRTTDMSTTSARTKLSHEARKFSDLSEVEKEIHMAFENFDVNSIKKAGAIFDGFCIWVTGLEGVSRERAAACVSRGGGVRYDGPHERVTHAVAAGPAAGVARSALPADVPVLSPLWLIRSVEAGRALDEAGFLVDSKPATPVKSTRKPSAETASPMSKRNLALLRHAPLDLPPPQPECDPPPDEIVNHYLSQNIPGAVAERDKTPDAKVPDASNVTSCRKQPDVTDDVSNEITNDVTEEIEQVFRGVTIEVQGLDEEAVCEVGAEVGAAGGTLVAAGAGGTHVLVPLDFDTDDLVTRGADAITMFWVKDCLFQQELVSIQYYHRPVKVPQWGPGPGPLHGVVASLSTYSGVERAFLDEVAKLLGATTQLRFCRRNTANVLASTHLICPEPTGDKYAGALKWGLPAVSGRWLLQCAAEGRRVSERGYLVGDTRAPPSPEARPVDEPQLPVQEEGSKQEDRARDKENAMLPPPGAAVPRRGSLPSREQTPKGKAVNDGEELSPASRYIAMARQGLLGGDSQETPKRIQDLKDDARLEGECGLRTPPLEDALSTPNLVGLSPTTRRRLQAVRRGEMPSDPIRTPTDPFEKNVDTPDSAFGAALRPDSGRLSPEARKRLWRVVNELPERTAVTPGSGAGHTPLSEIRNRFLAQFTGDAPTPPSDHNLAPRKLHLRDEVDTPPSKMAKLSEDHCPGSASKLSNCDSSKSASSASTPLPAAVDEQLQRLNAALANRASTQRARRLTRDSITPVQVPPVESEPAPESQPNTVGWDDTTPVHAHANDQAEAQAQADVQEPPQQLSPMQQIKRFMLSSNVDNRQEIIEMIAHLGGKVSDGSELDAEATHLLCSTPGRSEKMLGSIAGGRWVLHPAYVVRSRTNGAFLPEEDYEWGNPRATCLPVLSDAERALARAAHRWRASRAAGAPGPFAGVVALLHMTPPKRRLLAKLVIAGDGMAVEDEPPYTNEQVTVCFADVKRYPLSSRDASWLISKRIPVCAPILLSSYLTDEPRPVPEEHCLPEFRPK